MRPEFFTIIPSEITIDILSRLPARTIVQCKCVCKSWLNLLETNHFANNHVSKSVPGLAVVLYKFPVEVLKIYEFEDGLNLEHHELHYDPVTTINLPIHGFIQGSANGLLLLRDHHTGADPLYVCNPITSDCIRIDCPQEFVYHYPQKVSFGFGTSRASGQHKVVRVFHDCRYDEDTQKFIEVSKYECYVYTLGTRKWRKVVPCARFVYNCRSMGAFFNGNLHWFVTDLNNSPWISCFDLETEEFCAFSAPPAHGRLLMDTFALEDRLCVCDNSSYSEIVIWTMEEYGDERSWMKKFVISKTGDFAGESYENVQPIKVYKDGDILMAWGDFSLFYYSNKTETIEGFDMFQQYNRGATYSIPFNPSFLSLRRFREENVSTCKHILIEREREREGERERLQIHNRD